MTAPNRFFDDLSKLMTNALGVAQGARTEAETAVRGWIDRWMADRDFVTREEFDAVRAMAQKAREENDALKARLDALEGTGAPAAKPKAAPKPAAQARAARPKAPSARRTKS
jgi:hypothetical protein